MGRHSLFLRHHWYPKPPWFLTVPPTIDHTTIINEVLHILETCKPIEPALETVLPFLSPEIVNHIIQNPLDPLSGFRFFIWASRYNHFQTWVSGNIVLEMLSKENGFKSYWQSLEETKKCKFSIPADAFTVLVKAYTKIGLKEKAMETFDTMQKNFDCQPDVFTYNLILHLLMKTDVCLLGLSVFNKMLKHNCMPNRATFSILMGGLSLYENGKYAIQMFDEMLRRGILPNKITYTIIITGLCHAQKPDAAIILFNMMKDSGCIPDSITCNSLLNGFSKLGRVNEAYILLRSFMHDGYVLGAPGFCSIIDGLFRVSRYKEGHAWYKKMLFDNIKPDVIFYTVMMRRLSEAGKVNDALGLWREMTERGLIADTRCYNAMIKGFCDMGLLDNARSLQLEISKSDMYPNACTYTILISVMCRMGLVGVAQQILDEMEKVECLPSVITFNVLVDGLCKVGQLDKAQHLFHKMEIGRNPSLFLRLFQGPNQALDSSSIQKMVEGLCNSGLVAKAYKILIRLGGCGFAPDVRTHNILINGFCHARNINGALKLFMDMQLKGLSPDGITYGTLINGLQRADREADAFQMFDHMLKNGCMPSISVCHMLMTWSCRRGKVSLAFNLWLNYKSVTGGRDEDSFNGIKQLFEKREVDKAIRSLLEMDFRFNDFTLAPYTILLIGLCQAGRIEDALTMFLLLEESKVVVTPPCCVKLIHGLCQENLDFAVYVFRYALQFGYILMPPICNQLLHALLHSKYKRNHAFDLLHRMESLGYDLEAYLDNVTKLLLCNQNGTVKT